jgi:hypothetical protein
LRCLHKNPWHRYIRAYDLQTRLQHVRENLQATSGTNTTGDGLSFIGRGKHSRDDR